MSIVNKLVSKFSESSSSFEDVDAFSEESSWVSTGSPILDYNLRTLGFPTGIIEVRGESQSGKTTMSLMLMLQAQIEYGEKAIIVILSSERRDNKIYAKQIGIDVRNVVVHRVKTVEDVFNKIHNTVSKTYEALDEYLTEQVQTEYPKLKKSSDEFKEKMITAIDDYGKPKFIFIWDALGQTVSAQELKKAKENAEKNETGVSALGSAARSLGSGLRGIVGLKDDEDLTLFIVNRPYDNVDGGPGIKKSYGGKAIMLYPTMRLELARIQGIKVGEDEVGQITQVLTLKTDFDRPKQKFNVEIGYGLGFVLSSDDIQLAIEAGLVEKFGQGGAIYKLGKKELKWKTRRELYELYEKRDPMLTNLVKRLIKYAHDKVLKERAEKEKQWKNQ